MSDEETHLTVQCQTPTHPRPNDHPTSDSAPTLRHRRWCAACRSIPGALMYICRAVLPPSPCRASVCTTHRSQERGCALRVGLLGLTHSLAHSILNRALGVPVYVKRVTSPAQGPPHATPNAHGVSSHGARSLRDDARRWHAPPPPVVGRAGSRPAISPPPHPLSLCCAIRRPPSNTAHTLTVVDQWD